MIYQVRFTKEAKKDIAKLTPKLKQKLEEIEIKSVLIPMEVKN